MRMKKKVGVAAAIAGLMLLLCLSWWHWASPTRIALLNFQDFQTAKMVRSAGNSFVKVEALGVDEIDRLRKYDAVLVFGMGLRITAEDRAEMQRLADKGLPFYSYAVTSPDNDICNLDSLQRATVEAYLGNGGTGNFRSLFNYVRRELCGKRMFTAAVEPVREINPDCLFHIGEDLSFNTVAEYEAYLVEKGLYRDGQRKIALLTGIAGPFNTNTEHLDSIITAFQDRGYRVYPVAGFGKRMAFLQEIRPDAVIYLPHGRLLMGQGDKAVDWLREQDIPLFCPLTMNATYEQWMADKQGMAGGFLSQSVVMPEIDGGILPYALIAQYKDQDGLYLFKTIPERLHGFCETVGHYLDLRSKANKDKKIAVYYFKGPGSAALTAAGLEVLPSLYRFLCALRDAGYDLTGLPASEKEFEDIVMEQGPVFNSYAEGNRDRYLASGYPQWVKASDLDGWLKRDLLPSSYQALTERYGPVPGDYYTRQTEDGPEIAVTRIRFGNVVLLPQPVQGTGENSFQMVHGSNPLPPYPYIAAYFWTRCGFKADAMVHFGTHGSLEFIPGKQVALSSEDWSDLLVGDVPHFYFYTIADVGEGMIAKRRSYAVTVTHLNPPFMESGLNDQMEGLQEKIRAYFSQKDEEKDLTALNLQIKEKAVSMGLHRDLELDSNLQQPYSDEDIQEIDNFATELVHEKIGGGLYTLGVPFAEDKILSSVRLMSKDPVAFNLAEVDIAKGKVKRGQLKNQSWFASRYYKPAETAVEKLLRNPKTDIRDLILGMGVAAEDYALACQWEETQGMQARTKAASAKDSKPMDAASGASRTAVDGQRRLSARQVELAKAVSHLKAALGKVNFYREALRDSPEAEMASMLNVLEGGYVPPTSGGDFLANPSALPTGRNLYAINAETTPSATAWEKGKKMAEEMLADYAKNHGELPSKVSFTLWSGSFIESEGATLAQILYLLGVEPVRDRFGRVLDIRLIPEEELGRPRVDVVVQTSGQFRDLAASRLELLQRAIVMASQASDKGRNPVAEGNLAAERVLLQKGYSPQEARELSTTRVFGGINGMSGTGITGMVQAGDRWEKESEISDTYLHNMGAMYGSSSDWGDFKEGVFEAALQNTDVVVQPRQSNTWGALSLDHVYEFMGGLTLTVRNVTGKDPDNYFNDLRNRYHARVQDLRSAIGVEARTTFFNPRYIKEQMKGGASSAAGISDLVMNTYGWNVMKPSVIDDRMWDEIYEVYVQDVNRLGVRDFFESENPAALQEMTAVMLETARKGYWEASPEQLANLAEVHAELVDEFGACCNGFTCGNALLKDFVARNLTQEKASQYRSDVRKALNAEPLPDGQRSVVLEKEQVRNAAGDAVSVDTTRLVLVVFGVMALLAVAISVFVIIKRKRA